MAWHIQFCNGKRYVIDLERTIFKESTNLLKAMLGKFTDVSEVTVFRVISTDSYDLIIFLALVTSND
jgi:hypothetical protein